MERSDGTAQVGRVLPLAPRFVVTASPGAFGQGRPGLTQRWPWIVAFSFGLLHDAGSRSAIEVRIRNMNR